MSKVKRLRIFAGPNGSGKSDLYKDFCKNYEPYIFINSDLIEKEIKEKGFIDLSAYNIYTSQQDFDRFLKSENAQTLYEKSNRENKLIDFYIKDNVIIDKPKETHSYEASLITSFIREKLLETNQSFSFETVMSHQSKIDEINIAKEKGYKIYLYFICIDDPEINISRVANRVSKGGHNVSYDKIINRYPKTLDNLLSALKIVDRSFLVDNAEEMELIAETENGNLTIHRDLDSMPNWFIQYVINKL